MVFVNPCIWGSPTDLRPPEPVAQSEPAGDLPGKYIKYEVPGLMESVLLPVALLDLLQGHKNIISKYALAGLV